MTFGLAVVFAVLASAEAAEDLQPKHEDVLLIRRAAIHAAVDFLDSMIRRQGGLPSDVYVGRITAVDSVKLPGHKQIHVFSDPVINLKRKVSVQMAWPKADDRLLTLDIERRGEIQDGFVDGLNDRPGGLLVNVDPFCQGQVLLWERSLFPTSDASGLFNVQVLPATWDAGIDEASQTAPNVFRKSNAELQEYCSSRNAVIRTLAFSLLIQRYDTPERMPEFHGEGFDEVGTALRTVLLLKKDSEVLNAWLVRHADDATEPGPLNGLALGAYVYLAYFDTAGREEAQKAAAMLRLNEPAHRDKRKNAPVDLLEHCFARENLHFKPIGVVTDVHSLVNALHLGDLWQRK